MTTKKPSSIIGIEKPGLAVPSYLKGQATSILTGDIPPAIRQLEEINPAQVQCIEFRVLLKVMGVESITKGGIYRAVEDIERELFAKSKAQLISFGAEAFCDPSGNPIVNRPEPGDFVMIAKYAGITVRDKDFNLYRFANDKDVVAIIKGEKA